MRLRTLAPMPVSLALAGVLAGGALRAQGDAPRATLTVTFEDLPPGTYGVAALHDEDGDDELTMRWLPYPKPKEGVGASRNPRQRCTPAARMPCGRPIVLVIVLGPSTKLVVSQRRLLRERSRANVNRPA